MNHAPIYTIGYGAREIDAFLDALKRHGIEYLIDVRSKPYSRFKPDYSKDRLDQHLRHAGIRYVYMGDTLGGLPTDRSCYDENDKVDYAQVAERGFYLDGIERLATAHAQGLTIVLMCSEGKPEMCHRSKLIGKTLIRRGLPVAHIDENDEPITQDEVASRHTRGQLSLFGDDMLPDRSRKQYVAGREPTNPVPEDLTEEDYE